MLNGGEDTDTAGLNLHLLILHIIEVQRVKERVQIMWGEVGTQEQNLVFVLFLKYTLQFLLNNANIY